jgi:hypothetical protein
MREMLSRVDSAILGLRFDEGDSFGLMLLCYNSRFTEHATAILQLQIHPDADLVARSALEGMWQLKWTSQDAAVRAHRWRTFAPVRDWRVLRQKREAGEAIDPRLEQVVADGMAAHGMLHTKPKARRKAASGGALPDDPYETRWHGMTAKQLSDAVGAAQEYSEIYNFFSERHHWDLGDIIRRLGVDGQKMTWTSRSASGTLIACATVFSCYVEATQLLDAHFALGMQADLAGYLARFKAASDIELAKA